MPESRLPSAVHQFHSGTAIGDAITNEMLCWQAHLRNLGFSSEIYAQHVASGLEDAVNELAKYTPENGDVLLTHHSMGHDVLSQVLGHPHLVVPVYHNITPLEFIDEPFYRRYARLGQQQLRQLAATAKAGIADSNFNRREMLRAGFDTASVIPVKTDFSLLQAAAPIRDRTADWLFVGRVVPSKGQLELVDAFADAVAAGDVGQSLVLVGDWSDADYVKNIQRRSQLHGLGDRVKILGKVNDQQLAEQYRSAGLFVSMSKHEGFGVPLLEAMALGLAVVAYSVAAVDETLGGAGLAIEMNDSVSFVNACSSLQSNSDLYAETVHRQDVRMRRLAEFDVPAALLGVIAEAAGAPHRLTVQVQGPFETSYSLATLNRELALALNQDEKLDVSIYATEGPGDYVPLAEDIQRYPSASALWAKAPQQLHPDVVIRQMYPPRVSDSPGGMTFQYFGWEESRLPQEYVRNFSQHLDGIGVMSTYVETVLRDSGVTTPIAVVGVGVRHPDLAGAPKLADLETVRRVRFLHISSAFARKGVDVLLQAYFEQFSDADDVSLVLKTFPNPHNNVKEMLDDLLLDRTDPPHIVWIDRDMGEAEIDALYAAASVYVHPARGEGFGLPVAEAMAAGVPVIAPASTGLADFVSERTAFTVPFVATPAMTHLSVPGSMWSEPDRGILGQRMRALFEDPSQPDAIERADNARALISQQFGWLAVADRFSRFIDRERSLCAALSVDFVSTWNSRCGIAEYSADLVGASGREWQTQVLAELGVDPIHPSLEEFVHRVWHADPSSPTDDLAAHLALSSADVVHIQHNFGLFGLQQLAELIRNEAQRRAVFVTLHRTKDLETPQLTVRLADIVTELALADRIVVHQVEDAERLRSLGVERIEVIPIGARQFIQMPVDVARSKLLLDVPATTSIVATYGFLLPHKGTLELIQAVGLLRDRGMKIGLLAVCALHTDPLSAQYESECRAEIVRLGLGDAVQIVTEFLQPDVSHLLLSTADVVALPYLESSESSSAALRFVLSAGRPIVATDIGIFHDARHELVMVPAPPQPDQLALTLSDLLGDADKRHTYAHRASALAASCSVEQSAARHSRMYREAVESRQAVRRKK
jgi:glycosyltransferase involved in cell wall biosynthesis